AARARVARTLRARRRCRCAKRRFLMSFYRCRVAAAWFATVLLAHGAGVRAQGVDSSPPAPEPLEAGRVEAVADAVLAPHAGAEIASACVVVFRDDRVVFQKGYGFARPVAKVPADPNTTVYNVGSNSKLFVATAALQLRERGL